MRAPFDRTVNIYTGPGTATPYSLYIVNAPCRRVHDPLFLDTLDPQADSTHYLTIELVQPAGPAVTSLGGDKWETDVTKADRVRFDDNPTSLWKVVDVVLCTGPDQSSYWRCSIVLTSEQPWTPCQVGYADSYRVSIPSTGLTVDVHRVGPIGWSGGGITLLAETTGPPTFGCSSDWLVIGTGVWGTQWTGQAGTYVFPTLIPPFPNNAFVTRL